MHVQYRTVVLGSGFNCRLFLNTSPHALQAEPVSEAKEAIQSILVGGAPLTDLPPESLVDTETPLESQPDVQNTLETQQQHSAVYSPGVNEAPEQTPDQIAAVSSTAVQSKAPGQDQWLSKHSKRDKQQEGLAKASDKEGAHTKGAITNVSVHSAAWTCLLSQLVSQPTIHSACLINSTLLHTKYACSDDNAGKELTWSSC